MHIPIYAVVVTRRRELIEVLLGDEHPSFRWIQVGSADLPVFRTKVQKGEVAE